MKQVLIIYLNPVVKALSGLEVFYRGISFEPRYNLDCGYCYGKELVAPMEYDGYTNSESISIVG